MEKTEKTDNILFEDVAQTDRMSRHAHIQVPRLPNVPLNTISKYLLVLLVLVTSFLTLLWSRLDINETKVAMGNAQRDYRSALEENHRLQLELNLLLDPASIERQVETWDLQHNIDTIDIYEVRQ
jgi:hypothetical protein